MRKSNLTLASGLVGMLLSLFLALHGARACVAQTVYYRAKYGDLKSNTKRLPEACAWAHSLYGWNYSLCSLVADTAFTGLLTGPPGERHELAGLSEKWCDLGLALNPYGRDLRLRKAGILGLSAATRAAAIKTWEVYTDWNYWQPFNHCLLAAMYAGAGDFERAEKSARLIERTGYYVSARKAIDAEKKRLETGSSR